MLHKKQRNYSQTREKVKINQIKTNSNKFFGRFLKKQQNP